MMYQLIIILFVVVSVSMARVTYLGCDDMAVGTSVSQHGSIGTSTAYSIVVKRGSTLLINGESYIPGETLSVSLSSNPSQYAIEMEGGATFMSGGKCDGKRKDNNGGSITLPSTGSGTVKIKAVAGTGYSNAVNMLSTISLYEQILTSSPSAAPSGPSPAPTVQPTSPTPQPTIQPTATPTNSTMSTSIEESEILSAGAIAAIIVCTVLSLGSFGYYQYQSKKGLTKVAIEV